MQLKWNAGKISRLIPTLLLLYLSPKTETRATTADLTIIPGASTILPEWNPTSESTYKVHLFLAQEEVKCLKDFGGQGEDDAKETEGMTANKHGTFVNYRCVKSLPTFSQCEQCSRIVRGIPNGSSCDEICGTDVECRARCLEMAEKVKALMNDKKEEGFKLIPSSATLRAPEVFCEDMSLPNDANKFHVVVLKWSLDFDTTPPSATVPVVFVVQRMNGKAMIPQWETLGPTLSLIQPVTSPYVKMTYRYRITAVGPGGPLGRAESDEIETHDGFQKAGPPSRIYKLKEVVHDDSVDILVGWDPPQDKPCDYKVMQNRQDDEGKSVTQRFTATDLEYGLQVWFYGLKFDAAYDIRITSRRARWDGFESPLKSETFTMPSCLTAHNHRFDKCVPSRPRNVVAEEVVIVEEKDGEGTGQIKVTWIPPLHTTEQNKLKSYTLILGKPQDRHNNSNAALGIVAALTESQTKYLISGEVTSYVINNLLLNRDYKVILIATSVKGDSPPVLITASTYIVKEEPESLVTSWIYLSIPISLMILGIFGCHFLRVLVQKRQVKQARKQYFQSMDERDAMSPDWSIVPLNDDSPNLKFLMDGPKEKWEINYDQLIMGEVLGQGAFGVVKKAKMSRRKNPVGGKYSILNENGERELDELGMETVAVKMLKVSATRDDRDQLIKEIVTMQHLGTHPQIVSLLGACTKGRSLCLVLEYCPGGDLLSFLRKVRAKYWPTLGLSNNRQSWSDKSLEKLNTLRNTTSIESGCNSEDSFGSSNSQSEDQSPINYADAETSAPPKPLSPTDTVINHQYGKIPAPEPEDECRPIDEKDILSYARQISMGMEFLEKNRIVHRDLAARNVLLLGDCKQVKISDFGLSRDIYTWNVYHQKSNGKLPIKWMAIESIFTHVFTSKSDVWSFGILLWELVTLGGTPYPGLGNTELFHLLKTGYRMERPDNCSEEIYALMKKCWRTSPVSRPNFTELRRFLETMLEAAEPSLYLSLMADIPVDYFHISSRSDLVHLKLEDDSPLREPLGTTYTFGGPGPSRQPNNSISNPYSSNVPRKVRTKNPSSLTRSPPTSTPSVPDLPSASRLLAQGLLAETSCSTTAIGDKARDNCNSPVLSQATSSSSPNTIKSHPGFKRTRSRSLRSNSSSRIPLNESLQEIKRSSKFGGSSESLMSPDSGNPRSESGGGQDPDEDRWSDPDPDSDLLPLRQQDLPKASPSCSRGQSIPRNLNNTMTLTENWSFMG